MAPRSEAGGQDQIGQIRANWRQMGLSKLASVGDGLEPAVWSGAAALTTEVSPAITLKALRPEHCSTAVDHFTPWLPGSNQSQVLYAKAVRE